MKKTAYLAAFFLVLYLGVHQGQVALFVSNCFSPLEVFPYRAALYPKIDQQALRQGIAVESPEHLKQLLEDFLS